MNFLKIGKATKLAGLNKKLYRFLEILPGFFSWGTLIVLLVFSYFGPVWVAYFIIGFDVYWLLLVLYLGLHLLAAYRKLQKNKKTDWKKKCQELISQQEFAEDCLAKKGIIWEDIIHLIIFPTHNESIKVIRQSFQALLDDGYPTEKMIIALAIEGRVGPAAKIRARAIEKEFGATFREFIITVHPDNIVGELKGKGANQAWAAREVKKKIIDPQKLNYKKILVSVFDIDTVVLPGYFYRLTYHFLTIENPYRASYQPVPVYHNNIWQAPFFSRVAASSNTFWQMMQQIRQEKLAT